MGRKKTFQEPDVYLDHELAVCDLHGCHEKDFADEMIQGSDDNLYCSTEHALLDLQSHLEDELNFDNESFYGDDDYLYGEEL
jgi:hypothetical protein